MSPRSEEFLDAARRKLAAAAAALHEDPATAVSSAYYAMGCRRSPFLSNDVSLTDLDVPRIAGHRQVTDAQLLTVARRHGTRL